jgi:kynurenine formamidase
MEPRLTFAEVVKLFESISNWGRWGKEDERGALNFITYEKRAAAAALVRTGEAVSLGLPLAKMPAIDNPTPVTHLMTQAGADGPKDAAFGTADYFAIQPHGYANTHLDALCHVMWRGKMYNGFEAADFDLHGPKRCAIDVASQGIVSRGVLLDITKVKRLEWMEPGDRIFPEDLDLAEKDQRIHVEQGDVLLIRTGRARRRKVKAGWEPAHHGFFPMAGLDPTCLAWLHERRIALLGSDGVSDVFPTGYDEIPYPIHVGTLTMMGIHLLDNADLDELGTTASRLGRYEFQFAMLPLILRQGTASPVNPVAIF